MAAANSVPISKFDNAAFQPFPKISRPMLNYIFEMVKPIHLKKLYKTCKFFYVKYQLTLVGDVEIEMDGTIKSDASHWRKIKVPQNLDRIWLYGKLNDYHGNSEALSEFLTRCERINLEKIRFSAELTYEELKILTKSGDVWNLEVSGSSTTLEDILSLVPNAVYIEVFRPMMTSETMKNLLSLNFNNKLLYFSLQQVEPQFLNPSLFAEFIIKNANKDSDFEVKNPYATPYGTEELMEKFYHSVRVNLALCETFDNNFHGTFSVATFRIGRERML